MMFTSWIPQLTSVRSGHVPRHGKHAKARGGRGLLHKERYKPRLEVLEDRSAPAVSILNGAGSGFAGTADGGDPQDTNGAAGPSSYVEGSGFTVAIFNKVTGAPVTPSDSFSHFLFTVGGLTKITPTPAGLATPLHSLTT
jgi:hypothetical protein